MRYRKVERIVKGFANHRRLQILELLEKEPELSLRELARKTKIDFRTAGEHVRKLTLSGLVLKRNQGRAVLHRVSELGSTILTFCRRLD